MATTVNIIENGSLRATADGYVVGVRLNWYRSLPVSCLEWLTVSLDGQPVAPAALRFEVNGKTFTLEEAEDAVEEIWFVQDTALVHVSDPGKVKPGEEHTVEVEVAMRAPYIAIGPGKFLIMPTKSVSKQTASGG